MTGAEDPIRVRREMCETCIFRPGNLMHLRPGRLADMVELCKRQNRHIPCHEYLTLRRGSWVTGPGAKGAVCAGFFQRVEPLPWYLQVAERLGWIRWLPAPTESDEPAPPRSHRPA